VIKFELNLNSYYIILYNMKSTIIKPLLKWVGGKTQIIDTIISKFPLDMENYHEIFLGGGSVLFALLSYKKDNKININNNIYAYDLNEGLINLYNNIQNNPEELFKQIQNIKTEYDNIVGSVVNRKPDNIDEANTSKESYYYWVRKNYNNLNKNTIEAAAIFIFLNKTCFRGMFREGPNGFNVPFGNYKNPTIVDKEHLLSIHNLIKNVKFIYLDFEESFKNILQDDFVYLDPPYAPENNKSFVNYTKTGFNLNKHKKLFNLTTKLNNFLMSNSNVDLIYTYFPKNKYKIELIECKRRINSKNPQSTTKEVLITII